MSVKTELRVGAGEIQGGENDGVRVIALYVMEGGSAERFSIGMSAKDARVLALRLEECAAWCEGQGNGLLPMGWEEGE